MKFLGLITLLFAFAISFNCHAQRILAFDKRGKVKRIKYYQSDFIKLKLNSGLTLSGTINKINEKDFILEGKRIALDSVKQVFNTQKLVGFKIMGKILTRAGTGYFVVDSFNRLINKDYPVVNTSSAAIGAGLFGIGMLSLKIANKSYKISPKRPLKIIDISI